EALLVRLRIIGGEGGGDDLRGLLAGLAREDAETPRGELAVIGHASSDGQERPQLLLARRRALHLAGRHGSARAEEVDPCIRHWLFAPGWNWLKKRRFGALARRCHRGFAARRQRRRAHAGRAPMRLHEARAMTPCHLP